MSLVKLITNYAHFNLWANTEIVTWLKTKDPQLLYQESSSSFTSIDFTLQHILRTQVYWLAFISQEDTSALDWSVRNRQIIPIMNELIDISASMHSKFANYNEPNLIEILHLKTPWATNNLSRYEYIMHVINHSTFHRGQIITMACNVGIVEGIVNTDYNIFNSL